MRHHYQLAGIRTFVYFPTKVYFCILERGKLQLYESSLLRQAQIFFTTTPYLGLEGYRPSFGTPAILTKKNVYLLAK